MNVWRVDLSVTQLRLVIYFSLTTSGTLDAVFDSRLFTTAGAKDYVSGSVNILFVVFQLRRI